MTELRIAILGSGDMGSTYAQSITHHTTRARLIAISGGRRAPGLAAKHNVDYVERYADLLNRADIDAVLICTPHAEHRDQVIVAAQHGKHVLTEKPMATNVADCTAMIDACAKARVRLEVVKTLRFRGSLARAKKLILEGRIGQVRMMRGQSLFTGYVVDSKPWAGLPIHGGAYLDMGVHTFDIIRFLTGAEPVRIFSHITTFGDVAHAGLNAMSQVDLSTGAMAQHWISYQMPSPSLPNSLHRYYIVGESGLLDVDGYGKLQLGTNGQWETIWEQPAIDYVNRPFDPARLEAFAAQTQAFVDDILDNRPSTVSGEDGRMAVAMVEAAWRSSQTGQAVAM